MEFSLSAAARATGRGKSTIHNAIKNGKLSARRTEDGSYKIDASELARVFTLNPSQGSRMDDPEPQPEPRRTQDVEVAELRVKVAMLEDQLARERDGSRETIEDLRKRLDRAEERAYALTFQARETARSKGFLERLVERIKAGI